MLSHHFWSNPPVLHGASKINFRCRLWGSPASSTCQQTATGLHLGIGGDSNLGGKKKVFWTILILSSSVQSQLAIAKWFCPIYWMSPKAWPLRKTASIEPVVWPIPLFFRASNPSCCPQPLAVYWDDKRFPALAMRCWRSQPPVRFEALWPAKNGRGVMRRPRSFGRAETLRRRGYPRACESQSQNFKPPQHELFWKHIAM